MLHDHRAPLICPLYLRPEATNIVACGYSATSRLKVASWLVTACMLVGRSDLMAADPPTGLPAAARNVLNLDTHRSQRSASSLRRLPRTRLRGRIHSDDLIVAEWRGERYRIVGVVPRQRHTSR
jgi:hypothetical protein